MVITFNRKFILLLLLIIVIAVVSIYSVSHSRLAEFEVDNEHTKQSLDSISQRLTLLEDTLVTLNENVAHLADKSKITDENILMQGSSRLANLEEQMQNLLGLLESQARKDTLLEIDADTTSSFATEETQQNNPKKDVDEVFNNEPIDTMWSTGAAVELDQIFSGANMLVAQISDIDCRSTICRANITQEKLPIDDAAIFESHMLIELTKVFKGGVKIQQQSDVNGQKVMTAYLVREGHQMPIVSNNARNNRAVSRANN